MDQYRYNQGNYPQIGLNSTVLLIGSIFALIFFLLGVVLISSQTQRKPAGSQPSGNQPNSKFITPGGGATIIPTPSAFITQAFSSTPSATPTVPKPSATPTNLPTPTAVVPTSTPTPSNPIIQKSESYMVSRDYRQITFIVTYNTEDNSVGFYVYDPNGNIYTIGSEYIYGDKVYTAYDSTYRIIRIDDAPVTKGTWTVIVEGPEGIDYSIYMNGLPL